MAGVHKVTTGLTGLPVAKHPHKAWVEPEKKYAFCLDGPTLKVLYSRILTYLNKMPADAGYRKHTEQITTQRLNLVKTETDLQKLEEKINCGQIEEVIKQAERELSLSRKMLEWKPWEPLVGQAPPNQWKWPLA